MCVDFSVSICSRLHDHSMSPASSSARQRRPEVTREEKRSLQFFKKITGYGVSETAGIFRRVFILILHHFRQSSESRY